MKIPGVIVNMLDNLFKNKINELCNKYLKDYGRLVDHRIIFAENLKIELLIELYGEKAPLQVSLSGITVVKEPDDYFLIISKLEMEREWMQKLGQDFLDGRFGDSRIKLNYQIGQLLIKFFN